MMGEVLDNSPAKEGYTRFLDSMNRLSEPNNPRPLNPVDLDAQEIKGGLELSGFRFGDLEAHPEVIEMLKKPRFKTMTSSRGAGVTVVVDGYDAYQDLSRIRSIKSPEERITLLTEKAHSLRVFHYRALCIDTAKNMDLSALPVAAAGIKSRGSMQLLSDLIAFTEGVLTPEQFASRTNHRISISLEAKLLKDIEDQQTNKKDTSETVVRLTQIRQLFKVPSQSTEAWDKYMDLAPLPLGSPKILIEKITQLTATDKTEDFGVIVPQINTIKPKNLLGYDENYKSADE